MKNLWVCIACMLIVACSASQTPSRRSVIYVNDHWQQHNSDKLMVCYQKMDTMPKVNQCLLNMGVFI